MATGTESDLVLASDSQAYGLLLSYSQTDTVLTKDSFMFWTLTEIVKTIDQYALFLGGPILGTFLTSGSAILPATKVDARQPTGADTEISALDINEITQALLDLRSAVLNILNGLTLPATNASIQTGTGSPNGVVNGYPGSLYLNLSGGTSQTLWVQENTIYANTGWVAK